MFKKARRNFIIVAMSAVALVLIVVNVVVDIIDFNSQVAASDRIIDIIEKEEPPEPVNNKEYTITHPGDPAIGDNRYFIISFDKDLKITEKNLEHIDTKVLSEEKATEYAQEVIFSNQERGYKDVYRFHRKKEKDGSSRVTFLDCARSIENYVIHLRIATFSSLGALAACFLIIFFGSKFVLKPVKESYEKENRFITNASHELKTPLTIISANNELIEMKKGNNEYTSNINKQVTRMSQMIKDLTSLAKLHESKNIVFEQVQLTELINESLKDFKNVCLENNLKLKKYIDKNINIIAKKDYIKQMLSIILDNAMKYSKTFVDISLVDKKGTIILKEVNDAHNIENKNLNEYVERFYRGDKSRVKKEGSGIGLSLLEELANLMNAKIKIYGENNHFNIEIIFSNKNKIK